MLAIHASLSQAFEAQLNQHNVPDQQRRDLHKMPDYSVSASDLAALKAASADFHTMPAMPQLW
jgi:hypothetical protein